MSVVIGTGKNAKLFLPASSATWDIKGIVKKNQYDNILLLSFSIHDQEVVDIRRCFDETTHIFAFGRNVGNTVLQMSLLMFLPKPCPNMKMGTIEDIRNAYNKKRIYKLEKSTPVTIDGLTINGFLIEMDMGYVNPSTHTCVVTFTFIIDQEV